MEFVGASDITYDFCRAVNYCYIDDCANDDGNYRVSEKLCYKRCGYQIYSAYVKQVCFEPVCVKQEQIIRLKSV